jgi:hypothetical protein
MCGSNSQQTDAQAQEAAFSQQMMQENAKVFGQQQTILTSLNQGFQAIVANGPGQQGYSPAELNSLDTTATEDVASNMTNAKKALGEGQAAEGGGDTFIPSGVKGEQDEELAAAGATADAATKSQVLQSGFQQGNANYNQAVAGEETVASDLNPVGYSNSTTAANVSSADEANAIAASASSPFTAVMGALGGLAGAAATAYTGKPPCWIAAEIFGGWNEPRTELVRTWLVRDVSGTRLGGPIFRAYVRFGERAAGMVRRFRPVRWFFTGVFHLALRQARRS